MPLFRSHKNAFAVASPYCQVVDATHTIVDGAPDWSNDKVLNNYNQSVADAVNMTVLVEWTDFTEIKYIPPDVQPLYYAVSTEKVLSFVE